MDVLLVAAASAAATTATKSALSKLGLLISNKLKGKTKTDATYIKNELLLIQDTIRANSFVGASPSLSVWTALLRRLAYEIEDCIDCFQVKQTTPREFADEVVQIRQRSEDTLRQIKAYIDLNRDFRAAHGQGQHAAAAAETHVPQEFSEFLGKQNEDYLSCLLYFCMFPNDHHARRNPLIRRWLAEGLVEREDAAVKSLKTLIDNKIITATVRSNNGMMKRCKPAEEIHDFIKAQSSSTDFMLFCDDMDILEAEHGNMDFTRRLSLHPNIPNEETFADLNLPVFSHLHTLAIFHDRANDAIFNFDKYKLLRVLDLKECTPLCQQQLLDICKLLLLLKYLSFRGGIDRLPSEIRNLEWLETLDLSESGSRVVTVPAEVLWMPRLKHLLGKFQLSNRRESLISRRPLWDTDEVRGFLRKQSVLQTLSGFITDDRLGFPQLIALMRKLKKVKILCRSNASEANLDDISSAIKKFIRDGFQLQESDRSLSIDFQECSGQFLNTLQAEGSLTSLKLRGNLTEFPRFVARLSAIEELCLSSTALSWDQILAGLSGLRILKYLKLVEENLDVQILSKHLRSLERICLACVQRLDIAIQAGALPKLVSLHIVCQNLDVLPGTPDMEITYMAGLQEVGFHPQVHQAIKLGWENAAKAHPKKPIVLDVHIPLM